MSTAKNAILKAKVEGIIYEIMVKTGAANVYVDDSTTLATKLSEIVADINGKAAASHTHAQSDVTGLEDALTARPTYQPVDRWRSRDLRYPEGDR